MKDHIMVFLYIYELILCMYVQRHTNSAMDCGPDRLIDLNPEEVTGQYTHTHTMDKDVILRLNTRTPTWWRAWAS